MPSLLLKDLLNNCSQNVYLMIFYNVQLNVSTSATLGMEESSHYGVIKVLLKKGLYFFLKKVLYLNLIVNDLKNLLRLIINLPYESNFVTIHDFFIRR